MRNYVRGLALNILGFLSKPRNGVYIINAHFLNTVDGLNNESNFIKQLKHIKNYADLVTLNDAIGLINRKEKPDGLHVAYTFDDGFEECYTSIAPILESFNTRGGFFINPNFVECDDLYYKEFSKRVSVHGKDPMSWRQIKDLSDRGHLIGAHTMDHVDLGNIKLTYDQLNYQITECRRIIESKVENNCNVFAFPYGTFKNLSNNALEVAKTSYDIILSGTDYKNYYSFDGTVINRRHIEPFWPINHVNHFLSAKKNYN